MTAASVKAAIVAGNLTEAESVCVVLLTCVTHELRADVVYRCLSKLRAYQSIQSRSCWYGDQSSQCSAYLCFGQGWILLERNQFEMSLETYVCVCK